MEWILTWLWQGMAVALVTTAALRFTTTLSAANRYVVLWTATVAVLLLTLVALFPKPQPASHGDVVQSLPTPPHPVPLELPPVPSWWGIVLCGLWILYAGIRSHAIHRSLKQIQRIKRRCAPLPPQVERELPLWVSVRDRGRPASLRVSDDVGVACMAGLGNPMIVVPRSLVDALERDELDRVVVHEYGHVQRRDDWFSLLQMIIETICGWHPAVWYLGRALRLEREVACDDWVLARRGSARAYASCLTKVASLVTAPWTSSSPLTPGATRTPGELTTRIGRLLDKGRNAAVRPSPTVAVTATILLLAIVGGLGRLAPVVAFTDAPFAAWMTLPGPIVLGPPTGRATPKIAGPATTVRGALAVNSLEARPPAVDSRTIEAIGTLMSGIRDILDTRTHMRLAPQPLDAKVVTADAITLQSEQRPSEEIRAHVSEQEAMQKDRGWSMFADTGRVIGTKAAEAGIATGDAFSNVATGLVRVFGGSR